MTPAQLIAGREALHLSQSDLARTLGVAKNTVNRWEAGARSIPPYLPLAIAGIEHQRLCFVLEHAGREANAGFGVG